MIKLNPYRERKLGFNITVEGIDPQILEYNLRLSTGNVDYGFKGEYDNGKVKFTIPPLNEVVHEEIIRKIQSIKLEANDKNNKYYLKPFEDNDVRIQMQPQVEATLTEDENFSENKEEFSMDAEVVEDEESFEKKKEEYKEEPKNKKKKKKNSKLSKKLTGED